MQAPQLLVSHPITVPVLPTRSRRYCTSSMRGSTSSTTLAPSRVGGSGHELALESAACGPGQAHTVGLVTGWTRVPKRVRALRLLSTSSLVLLTRADQRTGHDRDRTPRAGTAIIDTSPVVARGLVKSFLSPDGSRVAAVDGVDFEAPLGKITAIVGQSGSGKTTLLQLLAGLDRPDAGSIRLAGVEISEASDATVTRLRRREVGFVFQAFNLIPGMSAARQHRAALAPRRRARRRGPAGGLADRLGIGQPARPRARAAVRRPEAARRRRPGAVRRARRRVRRRAHRRPRRRERRAPAAPCSGRRWRSSARRSCW